ncbi:MAG TPA: hypothetical protein VLD58_04545, partial [Gemmatimonadales bacterium]|nr:hypothetical protein [Gemmatimonadales bacterium]
LGAEYARVSDSLSAGPPAGGTPSALTDGNIYAAYGVLNIPNSKVSVIGRFDLQDPSTKTTNDHQTRVIGGVAYQVNPNLRVLADIDNLTLQSGAYTNAVQSTRTQGLLQMQVAF